MYKRSITVLAIFVLVVLCSYSVQAADQAYFSADKTTPLIGEPIHLLLHLRVPQNAQLALPDFKKSLSPFMVENVGSLNRVQQFDDTSVEYELPLEVVLWRTGIYKTPSLKVSYQLTGAASVNLTVESLQFEVQSVLNDNDLILRPFKPLVNLPYFPVWEIVPIMAVVVGVIAIFIRNRRARLQKRTSLIEDVTITGHPDAVYALKVLRQITASNDSPLITYTQVSDCLRHYLAKRFSVQALDLTTSELVEQLNEKAILADDHQQKLSEMLRRADLVKFAGVIPKQGAAQQYTSVAAQWIQTVEQANAEQVS